ncbi:hypothetical protein [Fodinicola feengrottensis]|uniref:YtxH domain-containing protein n=1 Tax=Fodinicola feengrottensis TaxID=435914 RepID=A0ABN2G3N6_9ACTN|nr:hypothetical protein [Fodinicola feengrottensis]
MRRLLWLGIGLVVGALVVRKLTKTAESYTPKGLADGARESVTGMLDSVREFVEEVREGMAEREDELLAALAGEADLDDVLADEGHAQYGGRR